MANRTKRNDRDGDGKKETVSSLIQRFVILRGYEYGERANPLMKVKKKTRKICENTEKDEWTANTKN